MRNNMIYVLCRCAYSCRRAMPAKWFLYKLLHPCISPPFTVVQLVPLLRLLASVRCCCRIPLVLVAVLPSAHQLRASWMLAWSGCLPCLAHCLSPLFPVYIIQAELYPLLRMYDNGTDVVFPEQKNKGRICFRPFLGALFCCISPVLEAVPLHLLRYCLCYVPIDRHARQICSGFYLFFLSFWKRYVYSVVMARHISIDTSLLFFAYCHIHISLLLLYYIPLGYLCK